MKTHWKFVSRVNLIQKDSAPKVSLSKFWCQSTKISLTFKPTWANSVSSAKQLPIICCFRTLSHNTHQHKLWNTQTIWRLRIHQWFNSNLKMISHQTKKNNLETETLEKPWTFIEEVQNETLSFNLNPILLTKYPL